MRKSSFRISPLASCIYPALFAMSLFGCANVSNTVLYQITDLGRLNRKSLDRFLWENVIKPEEAISNAPILMGDLASYHLVQIRGAEKPHAHEFHDLAVFLQSGVGTMFLGKQSFKVKAGSVIFIPHGTPHYFVNMGESPAVAIVVFSPAYDGKDSVPVELKKNADNR